jgi:hypothetical protein
VHCPRLWNLQPLTDVENVAPSCVTYRQFGGICCLRSLGMLSMHVDGTFRSLQNDIEPFEHFLAHQEFDQDYAALEVA